MGITIKRGPLPTDHFTIISNAWVRDESLPWAARGLLAWMQSHADGFEITEERIVAAGPAERAAVRTMTRALEEAGYLRRERTPIVTGGSHVSYVLMDPREGENRPLGNGGKTPPRADQGVNDRSGKESAGQVPDSPNGGKTPPRSFLEDQEKTKTPSVSKSMRATRITEDYIPDEKMRAWFAGENLHQVLDIRAEHAKFVDYFLAAPGVKGQKVNWPATWRNWMRTAAERAGRRPAYDRSGLGQGHALTATSGAPYKPSTTDQRIAQGQALAAKYREQGL